ENKLSKAPNSNKLVEVIKRQVEKKTDDTNNVKNKSYKNINSVPKKSITNEKINSSTRNTEQKIVKKANIDNVNIINKKNKYLDNNKNNIIENEDKNSKGDIINNKNNILENEDKNNKGDIINNKNNILENEDKNNNKGDIINNKNNILENKDKNNKGDIINNKKINTNKNEIKSNEIINSNKFDENNKMKSLIPFPNTNAHYFNKKILVSNKKSRLPISKSPYLHKKNVIDKIQNTLNDIKEIMNEANRIGSNNFNKYKLNDRKDNNNINIVKTKLNGNENSGSKFESTENKKTLDNNNDIVFIENDNINENSDSGNLFINENNNTPTNNNLENISKEKSNILKNINIFNESKNDFNNFLKNVKENTKLTIDFNKYNENNERKLKNFAKNIENLLMDDSSINTNEKDLSIDNIFDDDKKGSKSTEKIDLKTDITALKEVIDEENEKKNQLNLTFNSLKKNVNNNLLSAKNIFINIKNDLSKTLENENTDNILLEKDLLNNESNNQSLNVTELSFNSKDIDNELSKNNTSNNIKIKSTKLIQTNVILDNNENIGTSKIEKNQIITNEMNKNKLSENSSLKDKENKNNVTKNTEKIKDLKNKSSEVSLENSTIIENKINNINHHSEENDTVNENNIIDIDNKQKNNKEKSSLEKNIDKTKLKEKDSNSVILNNDDDLFSIINNDKNITNKKEQCKSSIKENSFNKTAKMINEKMKILDKTLNNFNNILNEKLQSKTDKSKSNQNENIALNIPQINIQLIDDHNNELDTIRNEEIQKNIEKDKTNRDANIMENVIINTNSKNENLNNNNETINDANDNKTNKININSENTDETIDEDNKTNKININNENVDETSVNSTDSVESSNFNNIILDNKLNEISSVNSINKKDFTNLKENLNVNKEDHITNKELKQVNDNNIIKNQHINYSNNNTKKDNKTSNKENDTQKKIDNNNNLFNELFQTNEILEEKKEKALKVIYNELLNLTDPTVLLKKVINILEKIKQDSDNIIKDSPNKKRKVIDVIASDNIKRVKHQTINNIIVNNDHEILNIKNKNIPSENILNNKSNISNNSLNKENENENEKIPQNLTNKYYTTIPKTPLSEYNTQINEIKKTPLNKNSVVNTNEVLIVSNTEKHDDDDEDDNTTITLVKMPINDDLLDTIIKSKKYKVIETTQKNINMDIINDTVDTKTPNSRRSSIYCASLNLNSNNIQKTHNIIPMVEIKKEIDDYDTSFNENENFYSINNNNGLLKNVKKDISRTNYKNNRENQNEILQHLFDHSSSYIPTRGESNRDSLGNASSSSANIYEEEEQMDMEKINSIRFAGMSERNKNRLMKIMRGKGSIKIRSHKELQLKENQELNSHHHKKEFNRRYNYNIFNNDDSYSSSSSSSSSESYNNNSNYIQSNKHSFSQTSQREIHHINNKNPKKRSYNYNKEVMQEDDYPHHYPKRQMISREKSLPEKFKENYYQETNYVEKISKLEKTKTKKSKSSKKIYPLFRKIKALDSNTFEKNNKEGKFQFLHQKLFTENSKNKEIPPDSIDSSFDTTTNTTDIALHLTLYNIQKYRKKRPIDKPINDILINFEKNIKKEFVLMNYEMKRREELLKILEKTEQTKQILLKKQ
ncbi:hypothetical protein PIROE2DRAFT_5935, partial [Piromyces sp. E2]